MASTAPPQAPSLSNTPAQVIMVPAHKPCVMRPVPGIKGMSIATIVLASICLLFGIGAAVVKARLSFVVNPIWSALLFMLPCGILGVFVHKKRVSFCMNISFLVVVIISATASFQLCIFMMFAVTHEPIPEYWERCHPYPIYWHDAPGYCTPQWLRILVDIAIICCALAVGVLNVISFSMTIYGTCSCCYNCCRNITTPTAAYNTDTWMPMSGGNVPQTVMATPIQNQQSNSYEYTRMLVAPGVGSSQPANQIPQPVYIMQPAANINPPQPQPYGVSNHQSVPPLSGLSTAGIQNAPAVNEMNTQISPTITADEEARHTGNDESVITPEKCSKIPPQHWENFDV